MKRMISGKVRDIYALNKKELVIVTTDRISAFDVILNSTIEGKGIALNLLSAYWFQHTSSIIANHMISTDLSDMPAYFSENPDLYGKRVTLAKRLHMLPYEFVVRGYMFGSLWDEYRRSGSFFGQKIAGEYVLAQKLKRPMVTLSIKNSAGHDEHISLDRLERELGKDAVREIFGICFDLYEAAYAETLQKGIVIADSKFEFGYDESGRLMLGDEIFTPDSSRFWAAEDWQEGVAPKSYDKQFVRDWLVEHKLNGVTPAPELPKEVAGKTAELYKECYCKITGRAAY